MQDGVLLDLRRAGVRRARQHPAIHKRPVYARGVFSAVFRKPASVCKLTLDPLSYALLSDRRLSASPHFPRVYQRYGIVGKQEESTYLYLIELERLSPIDRYPALWKEIRPVLKQIDEISPQDAHRYARPEVEAEALRSASTRNCGRSLRRALCQLADFVEAYQANLDLHADNIMVRPATRELVFSDPVVNASLYTW